MKKSALLLIALLIAAADAMSCSMSVDQNYTKNLLVAHAASYNDLSLANVTGISIADYGQSFEGGDGGGSCPDYLITSARVSLNTKNCNYAVTVTSNTYIGQDIPDGEIEDVTFNNPVAACSVTLNGVKIPRKLPIRIKRPILRFPR